MQAPSPFRLGKYVTWSNECRSKQESHWFRVLVSAENSVVYPACKLQDIGRGRRPCRPELVDLYYKNVPARRHGTHQLSSSAFRNRRYFMHLL